MRRGQSCFGNKPIVEIAFGSVGVAIFTAHSTHLACRTIILSSHDVANVIGRI